MNHNDKLDTLLDHALREYREAEPLAGMEARILQRIAAQVEPRSRRWTWILATAAAAAVVVVALWLGLRERPQQQTAATSVAHPAGHATASTAHVETPAISSVHARARTTARRRGSAAAPQVANAVTAKPGR